QAGVAGLGGAHAGDLGGRLLLGGDQPGVAAELLAALEATDGVDLQQDGHRDDPADPGDGLQRGEFGGGGLLGGDLGVAFEASEVWVGWAAQGAGGPGARGVCSSGMSAAMDWRLPLYFTSLPMGSRLSCRRTVWTWP